MNEEVDLDAVYLPSEDIVAREIEGEIVIIPLVSGIGDMEDELYTLNETARAIWERLDGKRRLREVVREISSEFDAPDDEIEKDVMGFLEEMVRRKMVVRSGG
jgi:coenzyme PQQ biosynthesis protein PqqD